MGKTMHSSIELPLLINYTCPYCGKQNSTKFTKKILGSSQGSLLTNDEKMRQRAHDSLQYELHKYSYYLRNENYRKLGLNVKCEGCGKKAPWADDCSILTIIGVVVFFVTLFFAALIYLFLPVAFIPILIFEGFVAIYTIVRLKTLDNKVAKLADENKPQILLLKMDD